MSVWDEGPHQPPASPEPDVPTSTAGPAAPPPPEPPPPPTGAGGDQADDRDGHDDAKPWWSQRIAGVPSWLLLVLAVVIWIGVAAAIVLPGAFSDEAAPAPAEAAEPADDTTVGAVSTSSPTTEAAEVAAAEPVADTTEADATTEPATTTSIAPATTTTAATTTTVPTTTTTTAPATTTTTVPTTTTTTTAPATAGADVAISEPSTVARPDDASLTVLPRRDACRYGPECFVVAFTIDGFAVQPREFVCEFSSGARFVFRFGVSSIDPACSTLDVPDSVVVEIDGLRSEPATISAG